MMRKDSEGECMTNQTGSPQGPQGPQREPQPKRKWNLVTGLPVPRDRPPPMQQPVWDGRQWVGPAPQPQPPAPQHHRVFLWVFLAVQALFLYWVISGAHAASTSKHDCGTLSAQACQQAVDVGAGAGVFIIVVFWVLVDVILGIGYGVYKLASRK